MAEQVIDIERMEHAMALFGSHDANIRLIEKHYGVAMLFRGADIKLTGEPEGVMLAQRAIVALLGLIEQGDTPDEQTITYLFSLVEHGKETQLLDIHKSNICITAKGKPVKAKTVGQSAYVRAISENTITLGIGPAGTGKTYLAVAMAVKAFRANQINRIILTRPAVEAGEKLGFLPGDLQNKVDPYLRPLYDALYDMLGMEGFARFQERGNIEVAPLAYMRGRTLDESFVILDEAQNATSEQMKMFLTRLGFGSKMVITGDITQVDLPRDKRSGLVDAMRILKGIEDIAICKFSATDVVRHRLVRDIISAYERAYNTHSSSQRRNS